MKRFSFFVCLALLLLLFMTGSVSAVSSGTTPLITGGSIFFDTIPPEATVWVDNIRIGTSPCTYFTEKNGTLEVRIQKKYYEDYSGNVSVDKGDRVVVSAILVPLPTDLSRVDTPPAVVVTTATIIEKRVAITVPTPWPSPTTPESPVDPAVVIGAITISIAFFVIHRR